LEGGGAILRLVSPHGSGSTGRNSCVPAVTDRYWDAGARAAGSDDAVNAAGGSGAAHAVAPSAKSTAAAMRAAHADHRCPSMISKPHCVNRRSAPRQRTHCDSDQQGSRRTIEPAGGNTKATMVDADRKTLAEDAHGVDHDRRRQDGRKEGVKGAAVVDDAPALLAAMPMGCRPIRMFMAVMVMNVRSGRVRNRLRMSARRRYDARELGDQKQQDQRARQSAYRPKPFHQEAWTDSIGCRNRIVEPSHLIVNVVATASMRLEP
jgi:hypothetical protein